MRAASVTAPSRTTTVVVTAGIVAALASDASEFSARLPGRLKKELIAAGVAVWLLALLVDRLAPGTRSVLDGGLAFTGCFAGVFIVMAFYIWAYFR